MDEQVIALERLGEVNRHQVGLRNGRQGELVDRLRRLGINVPCGFVTTAQAFRSFLQEEHLADRIDTLLSETELSDPAALERSTAAIQEMIIHSPLPTRLVQGLSHHWQRLSSHYEGELSVTVQPSLVSITESCQSNPLQRLTTLNVTELNEMLLVVRRAYAALFSERAISCRLDNNIAHTELPVSVCIQKMVRSDHGASGMVSTGSGGHGLDGVIAIVSAYGLGGPAIQEMTSSDEFLLHKEKLRANRPSIFKRALGKKGERMVCGSEGGERVRLERVPPREQRRFSLSDSQLERLGQQALLLEGSFGGPVDIAWGLDGYDGEIYILQAWPEEEGATRLAGGRVHYL